MLESLSDQTKQTAWPLEKNWHYRLTTVAFIAFAAVLARNLSQLEIALISAAFILSIGMVHGGRDHLVVNRLLIGKLCLNPASTRLRLASLALYLGIMILPIVIWMQSTLIALIFFLLVSMYHFGAAYFEGAEKNLQKPGFLVSLTIGGVPILTPYMVSPEATGNVFRMLLIHRTDYNMMLEFLKFSSAVCVVCICGSLLSVFLRGKLADFKLIAADLALTIIAYALLGPLAGFTAYFCLLHSIPSILTKQSSYSIPNARKRVVVFLQEALPNSLSAALMMVILMTISTSVSREKAIVETIFLGLFTLTIPHVIVNIAAEFKTTKQSNLRLGMAKEAKA